MPPATATPTCTKTRSSSRTSAPRPRQIAVKNIGRDQPTLLITNDRAAPGQRSVRPLRRADALENELDAYISGFTLNVLSSAVPLNVDLDTTLTVVVGNLYRLFAATCPATPAPLPTRSGGTS